MRDIRVDTTIFGTASLLALALGGAEDALRPEPERPDGPPEGFTGLWRNADGTVRLCLAADWSYEGSVAGRRRSAKGTYRREGSLLELSDESGLRTPVVVAEYGLEMAGHQLYKA
ncbi:hypothetical protein [Nucisporomicrobium flavum]|uniref:hypothetical protein n=1 Tax=Nucisporomicrobium flavum TaxID=2785915 RepID=UPI0018F67E70|nr:hypothetical protein [Nucisporomicrobium flavum]